MVKREGEGIGIPERKPWEKSRAEAEKTKALMWVTPLTQEDARKGDSNGG